MIPPGHGGNKSNLKRADNSLVAQRWSRGETGRAVRSISFHVIRLGLEQVYFDSVGQKAASAHQGPSAHSLGTDKVWRYNAIYKTTTTENIVDRELGSAFANAASEAILGFRFYHHVFQSGRLELHAIDD